jgi:hypothetical protein
MVIWHPPELVHENYFISDGHNLNLVFEPGWLESLPPDATLPCKALSGDDGLAYRFGLELYRGMNRDGKVSKESVINLISRRAADAHTHRHARWLARVLDWINDEYSFGPGVNAGRGKGWRSSSACLP